MSRADHIAAMKLVFPNEVQFHDLSEGRWSRPAFLASEPNEGHDGGEFYYSNMDGDRFYFETEDDAWLDLWEFIGEPRDLERLQQARKGA